MSSYESYMEDRVNASSLAPDELICADCGHDKAFHEDASSNPMPCDKMVRRYGRMKLCSCEKFRVRTIYRAPWIRTFPATHIHRLSVPSKNCWTLVIVLKPVREWGFWHLGKFMPWRDYVNGKDGIADKMKACK